MSNQGSNKRHKCAIIRVDEDWEILCLCFAFITICIYLQVCCVCIIYNIYRNGKSHDVMQRIRPRINLHKCIIWKIFCAQNGIFIMLISQRCPSLLKLHLLRSRYEFEMLACLPFYLWIIFFGRVSRY